MQLQPAWTSERKVADITVSDGVKMAVVDVDTKVVFPGETPVAVVADKVVGAGVSHGWLVVCSVVEGNETPTFLSFSFAAGFGFQLGQGS